MKKYTQQEINNMPNILKCHWTKEWIEESKKPLNYLGRLAILVKYNEKGIKGMKSNWETEGIDFEIVE